MFGAIDLAVEEWKTIPDEDTPYRWKKRELYYEALHRKHDGLGGEASVLFNHHLLSHAPHEA